MKSLDLTCPNCCARMQPASIKNKTIICEYCDSRFIVDGDKLRVWGGENEPVKSAPDREDIKTEHVKGDVVWNRYGNEPVEMTSLPKKRWWIFILAAVILIGGLNMSLPTGGILLLILYGIFAYYDTKSGRRMRRRKYHFQKNIPVSEKSVDIAFVLCLLLGIIGVHRFYVGKIGTGILYVFTGGLFGIGFIVDLVMIALGKFTDKNGGLLI